MAAEKGERNVIGKRIRAARLLQKPRVSQEDLATRLAVRGIISTALRSREWKLKRGSSGITRSSLLRIA
jgi:hypothetical protein